LKDKGASSTSPGDLLVEASDGTRSVSSNHFVSMFVRLDRRKCGDREGAGEAARREMIGRR
jgi:hypothetical protein